MTKIDTRVIKRRILGDVRVEAAEQFDRNFERESFFGEAWQRKKSPVGGKHLLVRSGALRRSISSRVDDDSVTFSSSLPYSAIHNEGGDIRVTARMKRFFWAMYYKANGGLGRRKDGTLRQDRRNTRLSTEAEFWKHLALMKVGAVVKIPRRRFIGAHPELERAVTSVIERRLEGRRGSPSVSRTPSGVTAWPSADAGSRRWTSAPRRSLTPASSGRGPRSS